MPPERSTLLAFAGAVVIGGGNFVAVKWSNQELDPMFGAALRFTGAAALLFVFARLRRIPLPNGRAAAGAAIYGALGFGASYAFIYYALVGLAAGTTSVIMASVPLLTLAFAVAHRQERFTTRGLVGGSLALLGIAVLSSRSFGGDIPPIYFVAAVLGAAAAAESSVVVKGLPRPDPITTNAIGMTVGAAMLWIASFGFGETWAWPQSGRTWLVLAYLVALGSVSLFILFLYVMERWTASATVYAIALMPLVAVTLGTVLDREPITWQLLLGGALVMSAVYLGALSRSAPGVQTG
ncbi:MAG: EamA family transporter, partial [Gemmatimonadetes bacterium]|nr:EamA family transporter [Gemmatimonadota bacterium]